MYWPASIPPRNSSQHFQRVLYNSDFLIAIVVFTINQIFRVNLKNFCYCEQQFQIRLSPIAGIGIYYIEALAKFLGEPRLFNAVFFRHFFYNLICRRSIWNMFCIRLTILRIGAICVFFQLNNYFFLISKTLKTNRFYSLWRYPKRNFSRMIHIVLI